MLGYPSEFSLLAEGLHRAIDPLSSSRVDPLRVLLDPDFTDVLWDYEFSRLDPEIPGSLHRKQVEALSCEAKHRLLFWGNQAGKSCLGAIDTVLLCLGRHPYRQWTQPPIRAWASALSWELWENILLPELLTWIPPSRIIRAPEPFVHSSNRLIEFRADNGTVSRIWGKSAEQGAGKYQSARVHHVWLDEEHPEPVWDEMMPRLLRFGGSTLTTATPLKGLTWLYWRIYESWKKGEDPNIWVSHAGIADNPSIPAESIEDLERQLQHNRAQLQARLYGKFARATGLALNFDPERHFRDWSDEEFQAGIVDRELRPFLGIDFGHWRFAVVLFVADTESRIHVLDEVFSQRETLSERAEVIDAMLSHYGIEKCRIWGDSANPQDIVEINAAFRHLGVKRRVAPVRKTTVERVSYRRACVEKINDLLGRDMLTVRKGIGKGRVWQLGLSASSDGHPIEGSRLLWEINNWQYPNKHEDKAQKQDPSDDSADGADAVAALRYAIMEHLRPAKPKKEEEKKSRNWDAGPGNLEDIFERAAKENRRRKFHINRDPRRGWGFTGPWGPGW